jgi:glycerophosphoryl diester phosphodiesterase
MKQTEQKPLWISHRGYCDQFVENTTDSFDAAIQLGFNFLETDLQVTKDGYLILCHDPNLKRLGGPETPVVQMTKRDIEQISLHQDSKVLFFDDFMERYGTCRWIFDIKPYLGEKTIYSFNDWLTQNNYREKIIQKAWFLFWNKKQENLLKNLLPGAVILEGENSCWRAGLSVILKMPFLGGIKKGKYYSLPAKIKNFHLFKKSIVAMYHKRGAKLIAFLPQSKEEALAAVQSGYDVVLTDKTMY